MCRGPSGCGAMVTEASLVPSSPLTDAHSTRSMRSPVATSYTVRSAASITPPVVPNRAAAPEPTPRNSSNSSSAGVWGGVGVEGWVWVWVWVWVGGV